MYSAEDEQWEEQLRKELQKKKEGQQVDPEQKAREDQLKKETAIRDRVTQLIKLFGAELEIFSSIAQSNPKAVHSYLPQIVPTVSDLMSINLTTEYVERTLADLSKCLTPVLLPLASSLEFALIYSVKMLHKMAVDDSVLSSVLENNLASLMQLCSNIGPLPAESFTYLFPICKAAILRSFSFSMQENALALIEMHTGKGLPFPRNDMLGSLIHLVSNVSDAPLIQKRATEAILVLCSGLEGQQLRLDELLNGILSAQPAIRQLCMQALLAVPAMKNGTLPPNSTTTARFWFAKHDTEADNVTLADELWKYYQQPVPQDYFALLSSVLSNPEKSVQDIAGKAIAGGAKEHSDTMTDTLQRLIAMYQQLLPKDAKSQDSPAAITTRTGVASALGSLGSVLPSAQLGALFDFFLYHGLLDPENAVRQRIDQAGLDFINDYGKTCYSFLLPVFEEYLKKPSENAAQDRVRESVAIWMGALARHLDSNPEKVLTILEKLIEVLRTPSESVQRSVSKCISPLMSLVQAKGEELVNRLLEQVQTAPSYAERRGAAYGLAGVVKGLGISSLKKYNVMTVLQTAVEDKKHPSARQGALFAFECLCNTLERLFEPYVIQILPKLLICYGDTVADVRDATAETSRAIMSQLSAHGVKLVLPALLKALEDRAWRTKVGSVNLIGSMAFCAPRQLSSCLPTIVPRLSVVLTDTHEKVQEAAREALGHIGSVIRNPEIQLHVPVLLKAMDDPDVWTKDALDALIHTNFVHTIDSPSLSLIMPVLHRGLKERSSETKKKSAQIIGNMCSLADHKDLLPYLEVLIPSLKTVVLDPIPEVRAITAKALGSLVKGLGEEQFPGLVPWFLETMKSDSGSVERSGAAQGLSEVLAGLDITKFESLLPDIIANTNHAKSHIREGYVGLFIFLPSTLPKYFQNYLDKILPCVLQGLADEVESVREISMRAGQAVVSQYAETALPLLLPTLEEGLFDDNWRIRQSSVQLLGELLYQVLGKKDLSDIEDNAKTISAKLGPERRNSILAALYLIRSDVSSVVRQKALLVWKDVVSNTPKTLREVLPTLMVTIINCLGSSNLDKRQVASRTLGDLVQKLGERILPEIIPILENGLNSPNSDTKQGVCLGLSEVMGSMPRNVLAGYIDVLIPAVRKALCDNLPEVREAAAQAFDMLYKNAGAKALDEILPALLLGLSDETSNALDAIRQILTVRSATVLPFLVPKLLTPPITSFNVRALASIAEVSGSSLNQHLSALIPALIEALAVDPQAKDLRQGAETIILAVQTDGVHTLLVELTKSLESSTPEAIIEGATLLGQYCANTKANIDSEIPAILKGLLLRFNDPRPEVQKAACGALGSVTNSIKKESLISHLPFIREVLEDIKEELQKKKETLLPGFCLDKGLSPVLPAFLNGTSAHVMYSPCLGLMMGSPEIREQAAAGLGDLINLTSENALKPFVIQITGPLIRIVGDRFPWQVKAAILQTLNLLIGKGGIMLKPFIPQLQSTFIKALQDTNRGVRIQASTALGSLMSLNTKVDPLIIELLNGLASSSGDIQETMLTALQQVLLKGGKTVSPDILAKAGNALFELLSSDEDSTLVAKTIGAYSKFIGEKQLDSLLAEKLLVDQPSWQVRNGSCLALKSILKHNPEVFGKHDKAILSILLRYTADDKASVRQSAAEALSKVILLKEVAETPLLVQVLTSVTQLLGDSASDVKLSAVRGLKKFAKQHPTVISKHLPLVVPPLMERIKDRSNFPVKLASERALMHALQIHTDPETLKQYSQTLDQATARTLVDYAKRVLSKLTQDSASDSDNETQ